MAWAISKIYHTQFSWVLAIYTGDTHVIELLLYLCVFFLVNLSFNRVFNQEPRIVKGKLCFFLYDKNMLIERMLILHFHATEHPL